MPEASPNTFPRSSRVIEEQLADLANVKRTAAGHGQVDFASGLFFDGLVEHERELRRELDAARLIESASDAEADEHVE